MTARSGDQIRDDLRGHFAGELLCDDRHRSLYAADAGMFEVLPTAVARPRHEDDLRVLLRYAVENHLPIIPRGAGTGLAGEAIGPGLIVDLSCNFRRIVAIADDTVTVEPGVVLQTLNERLATVGRRFAPDSGSANACTIGGMLATNASGSRAVVHGYTRDHVAALRVMWDNGEVETVARRPLEAVVREETQSRTQQIVRSVCGLIAANRDLIRTHRPRTMYNRAGYLLHDVLWPGRLDLAKLLVGSEGTLALFTQAVLRTIPLPAGRSVVLLGFPDLDAALKAAQACGPLDPTMCDLLDRRLLALVRKEEPHLAELLPAGLGAALLLEFEANSPKNAKDKAFACIDLLQRKHRLALLSHAGISSAEIARIWATRTAVIPALYSIRRGPRPAVFIEDIAVPVAELPTFVTQVQDILQRFEITASFLIHVLAGQIHTRPFLDPTRPEDTAKMWPLADEVYGLALKLGGTISTQHGTGIARTPWIEKQFGPLAAVFRELKAIFDPHNILNPGKIVGPDPARPAWPLRPFLTSPKSEPDTPPRRFELFRTSLAVFEEVNSCTGCGDCRREQAPQRMCPIFRTTAQEEAAPRAKASLLRRLLGADGDPKDLHSDAVRAVADLCINCRMCATECPAKVNIPRLMLEAKIANQAAHGLSRLNWVLARTESFAVFGSNFAPIVNRVLGNPLGRWLLEKLFGISRRRRLPKFASRTFLQTARKRGWTRKPNTPGSAPKVAFFVDVFANSNDPLIAEAVMRVLRHNGIEVFVPRRQRGCGMAALAQGDVETAREAAQHNLRQFADLARDGWTIVCAEPTAALMLRDDYRCLADDPDTDLVADSVVELTSFLRELHRQGRLRTDFQRVDLTVGHHVPCHLKALGGVPAGPQLLGLIPGVRVLTIDKGCSGMAGTFGLQAANYKRSLEAGRPMLTELLHPRILFGSTECSSCRMQMQEGAGKRTLHPIQYLAWAYGLLPELNERIARPLGDLVTD